FLAALLLAAIGWGAIAEATHCHGNQTTLRSGLILAAGASRQSSTARLETTETGQTRSSDASQCLICQLQQNLATILFAPPLRIATGDTLSAGLNSQTVPPPSRSALPQQGRAPPITL